VTVAAPVRRGGGVRRWLLPAYPLLLVVLTLVQVLAPRRNGPLGLTEVFAPWLFLPLLVLLPFAWALRERVLVVALVLAVVAFAAHLGPGLVPGTRAQPPAGSVPVRVASWNVYVRNPAVQVVETVRSLDADVVGLVEVNPRQARRLDADPSLHARYRTMLLVPEANRALLSRYPLIDSGVQEDGSARSGSGLLWARLDLGGGRRFTVVVAHPLPAEASPSSRLPLHWDARPRDAEIAYVKAFVDARIAAGERVVLMGDFNVTDREPANAELSRGLRDAHDVAWGAGASWGPLSLRRHGLALIRIDRVLGGPGTVPTGLGTDCTFHGSDHCILRATLAVAPTAGTGSG
jgi:endonuclease/exonuclease/phosphatase family metal-dependent hydrolase